jgi:hypothetical protein
MTEDEIALAEIEAVLLSTTRRGGAGGGTRARPHGVIRRTTEERDGKLYEVEVLAPESFPSRRRGKGRVAKYATPKPRTVENGGGSGSGLWTGSQGDQTLRNATLRHTVRATKWARKHGDLLNAPWEVIGRTNLYRAVRAARDFEAENCPVYERAHVIDDYLADLEELIRDEERREAEGRG